MSLMPAVSYNDCDYVYKNYSRMSRPEIANAIGKSAAEVDKLAYAMNLSIGKPFTKEEKTMATQYAKHLGGAIVFLLPHRTTCECEELIECTRK